MKLAYRALLLGALCAPGLAAQSLRSRVDAYRSAHDVEIVRELSDFLAIRNLASDSVNIRLNAQHILTLLSRRGIEGRLLESPAGGPPAVFGELRTPGAVGSSMTFPPSLCSLSRRTEFQGGVIHWVVSTGWPS
jgi:hypothetical protein